MMNWQQVVNDTEMSATDFLRSVLDDIEKDEENTISEILIVARQVRKSDEAESPAYWGMGSHMLRHALAEYAADLEADVVAGKRSPGEPME